MTARQQRALAVVDELADRASHAEPPALDELAARRMIERALDAPRPVVPIAAPAWRRALVPAAIAAIAIVVAIAWPRAPVAPAVVAEPPLLEVSLPTGDRLVGTAGARFDIDELAPESRRLQLRAGTIVFDVAHVVAGQRFEVATERARLVAIGTVFSVTVDPRGTRAHVYEGRIEVHHDGRVDVLGAGASWSEGTLVAAADPAPLVAAADARVTARQASARRVDTAPVVTPIDHDTVEPPPPPPPPPPRREKPAPPPPPPTTTAPDPFALARSDLAAGRYAEVIARADARGELDGAWLLVVGDAHRGLGHAQAAADTYDRAAAKLTGTERAEAGYSAAYLRHRTLHDAAGALASLRAVDGDAPGSPLEERGLALAAQLVATLDRKTEARELATRYLQRFPRGELVGLMRTLAR
ncbi:MAG TPA: FecR domain-containing protein [Kofleriaceae bacterium]|nr:FecR domain-containing protein [Kofleriaceae bacterium]